MIRTVPRLLFRYIFGEALPYITFTFLILTLLIFAQQVARQGELIFTSPAASLLSLKLMAFLLPGVLVITLPFALLIGSLMALNRLSSDSEIIAARASGISYASLTSPLLLLGILGACVSAYLTVQLIPQVFNLSRELKSQLVLLALTAPIKPQVFDNHFPNHLVYIRDIDKQTGDWLGVFILRKSGSEDNVVLTARRGVLRMTQTSPIELEVVLNDGALVSQPRSNPEKQNAIRFRQQSIRLSSENPALSNAIEKALVNQELSLKQLSDKSKAGTTAERRQAAVEFHKRLSLPIACIVLVLLAVPFGVSTSRQAGRAVAFATGFGLAITYYIVSIAGQNLSLSGAIPAWIGIWLPNLLGLVASWALWNLDLRNILSTPLTTLKHFANSLKLKSSSGPPIAARSSAFSRLPAFRIVNLINYLIFSELGKFFGIAAGVLVLTSIIFTLFDLIPSLSRSQLGWGYAAVYLAYLSPQIAYYISPFAFLLAVLTLQGVLSKTNQLTAIVTSGQSYFRLALPLVFSGLLLISLMFWASERILPFSNQEQDLRYNRIKGRKTELAVTAFGQSWVRDAERDIYGYQIDQGSKKLLNTSVYRLTPEGESLEEILQVDEATPSGPGAWQIVRGYKYQLDGGTGIQFSRISDRQETLTVPEGAEIFTRAVNEAAKMSFRELKSYIKYLSDLGVSTTSLRVDLEKKLSFPFSCITLMVLAFPFAVSGSRRSNLAGIGISIIIGFVFWILASVFESAGRQAYLPAGLCVWGPQALFIALGLTLTFRRR